MKSLLDPTRRRALAPAHHHGLLFITLRKSEALSSQTTRTRDLALGFADYVSYEGERPIPGASIRSWRWRFEGTHDSTNLTPWTRPPHCCPC
ncbi:hypothetical protein KQ302_07100 [Synechococcus sp. CS-602]|uniref:hypothetical protein n=1 Tax=Synechococcaceae TaxID=1890426 RepID=UPI0021A6F60D|nr:MULTISPECIES: hypothetical protein [Synechococcaceae]MCT0202877.1 hypothetical protein [Synechococcus sp. CS-603]MCT0204868.1 hypothetical protein [Synechococcus sp. CS-602]MCT4367421.1 hypothetical protein [Candidatus Regnicoccus frigidus MAG-AL2]